MSFWNKLFTEKKIVLGLSPMDGVTDVAMRFMTAKYGRPDILFTEFVSVDALAHAKEDKSVERIMKAFLRAKDIGKLDFMPYEIAQMFGHTPELFYQAAVMIATLGFDGMDINMGCPMHKVEDQGSGAGLIRTPEIAQEIIRQSTKGMEDYANGKVSMADLKMSDGIKSWVKAHAHLRTTSEPLPVSVKTRIGVDKDVSESWMKILMEVNPANISLHGRTLRQLYQGNADWDSIARAASVVHKLGGHILGNGDVENLGDVKDKVSEYGVDGVLIGRAAEGNPEVFIHNDEPTRKQKFAWMIEHALLHERISKPQNHDEMDVRWFMPMRKHLAWYTKGFPGAVELRSKLMLTNSAKDVSTLLNHWESVVMPDLG
jgi:tRNA-dihydrouridine synthase